MTTRATCLFLAALLLSLGAPGARAQSPHDWRVHDLDRPQPPLVTPGTFSTQETPGKPPSDAIVLFDGTNLDAWKSAKGGGPAPWKVENGYLEVVDKSGYIETKQAFGRYVLELPSRSRFLGWDDLRTKLMPAQLLAADGQLLPHWADLGAVVVAARRRLDAEESRLLRRLPGLGVNLPLSEVYRGIALSS